MLTASQLLPLDAIDQLPFTPGEFDARLAACRRAMTERGLDYLVLSSPENIYYLSGFITKGYYVFQALVLTHTSDPILVVRRYEQANVERLSYYRNAAIWQDTDVPAEVLARALVDLGALGKTVGVDANSMFLTVNAYETLRAALPGTNFVNASTILERCRAIKSPQEIAYIRRAAETLSAGFKAAHEAARPGRTENDVAAAFHHAAISAGSEYMGSAPYIASGPRTALPHATWAGRCIEKGDLVIVEGSGNWKRYSAALMRTWCLGKPSDSVRRAADTSKAALAAAIAAMRPGVTSGEVDAACRGTVARAGLAHAFLNRTGYSVGVGICPGWGEGWVMDLKDGDPRVLHPGMVFHIVPVLFPEPNISVGFSATVLVTETGAEIVSDYSRELEC
ncbi:MULTISPECIES: Xaa-Pro peptidase family protein [unclassified Mesorhizobium]|uniref:M24 family metallopeptidase n=3 Tax=Mesorhizobium TaxID=68287 RepID=UPI000F754B0A|nr:MULTISPECIES: Xaa-Pro peptidase family protein [unclassified Mesorhizobium]TGQ62736.1 aminopeptidase P family protein [bacterium M00.F.Ca.ET.205.01.1.1]TGS91609.1 aminopeptidase P family protein [bacterium M00.F.Ca.ET.177.01.1.1]TGT53201.1 aminopeptidase P family protein [Mesorhizobium sp. M00.F.Ca.ET.170.01.1.1]TGU46063.1 aminopeptidase P family protein [bacterium M00.F.Ca.ET.152.01.1.1]TGV31550.1 aminopeptidase P family protein [Mesorhizobium sp. M00.F.Ca.ET.186.01.1.1]TGZ38780.1 aminope